MGTITRPYTYTAGNTIDPTEVTSNETTLYNEFNGNIDNNNIKSSAAIAESKLAFNTSTGHNHDGSNSKAIPKGMMWQVNGTLVTGANQGKKIPFLASQVISKAYAFVDTAPSGADLIVDIDYSTDDGATWISIWNSTQANRLTITDGTVAATQTSFDTTSFSESDLLRLNIDQVGSSTSGVNLTVVVK